MNDHITPRVISVDHKSQIIQDFDSLSIQFPKYKTEESEVLHIGKLGTIKEKTKRGTVAFIGKVKQGILRDEGLSSTIYDDIIRTECERHLHLFIPLVNKYFGTHYTRNATIRLLNNEHHNTIMTNMPLKVTDAYFEITENGVTKRYHLECQSNADATMIVRIVEYDFMIAIDEMAANIKAGKYNNKLVIPETMVMYLRHKDSMPDKFTVDITYKDQHINYVAPIIKTQQFSLEDLEKDELYLIIPFYLIRYESIIKSDGITENDIKKLIKEIENVRTLIERLVEDGKLVEYDASVLMTFSEKVVSKLTEKMKHKDKERLVGIMKGNLIDTEAYRVYESGRREGERIGERIGEQRGEQRGIRITKAVLRLDSEGYAVSDIAIELSITEEKVKEILEQE